MSDEVKPKRARKKKVVEQPRKKKTVGDLITDMQKIEKKVLNMIAGQPAEIGNVAGLYKNGFSSYTSKQKDTYHALASKIR